MCICFLQFVTKRKCLVQLPKKVTVATILTEFLATKKQRSSSDKIFVEIVEGAYPGMRVRVRVRVRARVRMHMRVLVCVRVRVCANEDAFSELSFLNGLPFPAGIRLYFDKALGTYLLYRFERPQYEKLYGMEQSPVAFDTGLCRVVADINRLSVSLGTMQRRRKAMMGNP